MLVLILVLFFLGISIGSFINALVYRLEEKLPIVRGRSMCIECKRILAWHDLIPLVSYFQLRGKCRYCKARISWQYLVVELVTGIAFILPVVKIFNFQFSIFNEFSIFNFHYLRYFVFVTMLMVIFAYDLRYMLIPDRISLSAIVIVFLLQIPNSKFQIPNLFLAALIGFTFFFLQFILSKGTWIGGGDLRLGFLMGLMLGFPNIVIAIFLSYILGSIVSLPLVAVGRKRLKSPVPFGVFLTTATIAVYLWGDAIRIAYFRLIL